MKYNEETALSKVPEVTLLFWVIKIAATTLGETGGDALSMSMHLGYLTATAIFAGIFVVAVAVQIKAKGFHHGRYDPGRFRRPLARDRLRGRQHAALAAVDLLAGALVSNPRDGIGQLHQFAQGRDLLLGDHHVFPDPGHGPG
jgi:hypothetical protein